MLVKTAVRDRSGRRSSFKVQLSRQFTRSPQNRAESELETRIGLLPSIENHGAGWPTYPGGPFIRHRAQTYFFAKHRGVAGS